MQKQTSIEWRRYQDLRAEVQQAHLKIFQALQEKEKIQNGKVIHNSLGEWLKTFYIQY